MERRRDRPRRDWKLLDEDNLPLGGPRFYKNYLKLWTRTLHPLRNSSTAWDRRRCFLQILDTQQRRRTCRKNQMKSSPNSLVESQPVQESVTSSSTEKFEIWYKSKDLTFGKNKETETSQGTVWWRKFPAEAEVCISVCKTASSCKRKHCPQWKKLHHFEIADDGACNSFTPVTTTYLPKAPDEDVTESACRT